MAPATLSLLACALYFAAAGVLGRRLKRGSMSVGIIAALLWFAALISHAAGLVGLVFTGAGLNLALFKAASVTAALLAAILLFNCLRKPLSALALPMLPIISVLVALGNLGEHQVITVATPGIRVHILSSLLAYSVLGLGGLQAVMLHFQNRELRGRAGPLLRLLPPLDAMESFLFHLLALGLALLTLSLATGWLYHHDLFAQHLAHKTFLSGAAWLLFATLLTGHLFAGWRGERAVQLTLAGLGLLIIGYFGSKFVLEYVLQRV